LAVFFTQDFRTGSWAANPVNSEGRYSSLRQGSGRNGGSVFRHERNLFRVMQSSRDHYGQAIEIMQITKLTPQIFEEAPARAEVLPSCLRPKCGFHHLSVLGTQIVWDVRDRFSYRQHLGLRNRRLPATGE
jgi:hypothetical protein